MCIKYYTTFSAKCKPESEKNGVFLLKTPFLSTFPPIRHIHVMGSTQLPKVCKVEKRLFLRKPSSKQMANLSKNGMSPTFGSRIGFNTMEESFSDSEGKV